MPTQQIQQATAVRDRSDMQGVDKPGTFTVFNDNSAVFCGDGSVTFRGATSHFIGYMAKSDSKLARLSDSDDAATLGARLVLQQNPTFSGCSPDDAVPRGAQVQMNGDSLKALLKPYASDDGLKQLRSALESMTFDAKPESRVTGQVRSKGLGLPTDPRF
jgi:hypothetical protein